MPGPLQPSVTPSHSPNDIFRFTGTEKFRSLFTERDRVVASLEADGDPVVAEDLLGQRAYMQADKLSQQVVQDAVGGEPTLSPNVRRMVSGLINLRPDLSSLPTIKQTGRASSGRILPDVIEQDTPGGSAGATISESFMGGVMGSTTLGFAATLAFGDGETFKSQKEFNDYYAEDFARGEMSPSMWFPTMTKETAEWRRMENRRARSLERATAKGQGLDFIGFASGLGGSVIGDAPFYMAAGPLTSSFVHGGLGSARLAAAADATAGGRAIVRNVVRGFASEFGESVFMEIPLSIWVDKQRASRMGYSSYTTADMLLDPVAGGIFGGGFALGSVGISKAAHTLNTQLTLRKLKGLDFDGQRALLSQDPVFLRGLEKVDAAAKAAGKDDGARQLARDAYVKTEYPGYIKSRIRADALAEHLAESLHLSETGDLSAGQARDTMKDAVAFAKLTGAKPEYFATIGDSQLRGRSLARAIEDGFNQFAADNGFDDTAATIFRNAHLDAYRKSIKWAAPDVVRTGVFVDGSIGITGAPSPDPSLSGLQVTTDLLNVVRPTGAVSAPSVAPLSKTKRGFLLGASRLDVRPEARPTLPPSIKPVAFKHQGRDISVFQSGNRAITFLEINGVKQPFYISTGTGGKKSVAAGKWYPFFGFGPDGGWLNKGTESAINSYYGSALLKQAAEYLDRTIGNRPATDFIQGIDFRGNHSQWQRDNSVDIGDSFGHLSPVDYGQDPKDNIRAQIARIERNASSPAALVNPLQARVDAFNARMQDMWTEQHALGIEAALNAWDAEQAALSSGTVVTHGKKLSAKERRLADKAARKGKGPDATAREAGNYTIRLSPDEAGVDISTPEKLTAFQKFMDDRGVKVTIHDKAGMDKKFDGAAGAYDPKTETLHFSTEAGTKISDTISHEWVHRIYDTDNQTFAQLVHALSTDVMVDANNVPFHITPDIRAGVKEGTIPVSEGTVPLFVLGWNTYRSRAANNTQTSVDYWNKSTTAVKLEEAVATAVGVLFQHPEAARGFIDSLTGPDAALAKVFLSELLDDAYKTPSHITPYADVAYTVGSILAKASGDGKMGVTIGSMGDMLGIYGKVLELHGFSPKAPGMRELTAGDRAFFPGKIPLHRQIDSVSKWYAEKSRSGRSFGTDSVDTAKSVATAVEKAVTVTPAAADASNLTPLQQFVQSVSEAADAEQIARNLDFADSAFVHYLGLDGSGIGLSIEGAKAAIPLVTRTVNLGNPKQDIYSGGASGFASLDDAAQHNGIPNQSTLDGLAKLAAMGDEAAVKRLNTWGKLIEHNFVWKVTQPNGKTVYKNVFVTRKPKGEDWSGVGKLNYPDDSRGAAVGLQLRSHSAKTEKKSASLARAQIGQSTKTEVGVLRKQRFEYGLYSLLSSDNSKQVAPTLRAWLSGKRSLRHHKLLTQFASEMGLDLAAPNADKMLAAYLGDYAVRTHGSSAHKEAQSYIYDINKLGTDEEGTITSVRRDDPLFIKAAELAELRYTAIQKRFTEAGDSASAELKADAKKTRGQWAYAYLRSNLPTSPFSSDAASAYKGLGVSPIPQAVYTLGASNAADELLHALVDTVPLKNAPVFYRKSSDLAHLGKTKVITGDHRLEFYDADTLDALTDNDLMDLPHNKQVIVVYTEKYNPADEAGAVTEEDPLRSKSPTNESIGRKPLEDTGDEYADTLIGEDDADIDQRAVAEATLIASNHSFIREELTQYLNDALDVSNGRIAELPTESINNLADSLSDRITVDEDSSVFTEANQAYEDAVSVATQMVDMVNGILRSNLDADTSQAMLAKYLDAWVTSSNRRVLHEGPARNDRVLLAHRAAMIEEISPIVADSINELIRTGVPDETVIRIINREFTTLTMLRDNFDAAIKAIGYTDGQFHIKDGIEIEGPSRIVARELVARLNKSNLGKAIESAGFPEWHEAVKALHGTGDVLNTSAISEVSTPSADATSLAMVSAIVDKTIEGSAFATELRALANDSDITPSAYAAGVFALYVNKFLGITNRRAFEREFGEYGGHEHVLGLILTYADSAEGRALVAKGDIHGFAKGMNEALEDSRKGFTMDVAERVVGETESSLDDTAQDLYDLPWADDGDGIRPSVDVLGKVDESLTRLTRYASNINGRPPAFAQKNITRVKPPAKSPEAMLSQRYSAMKSTTFILGGESMAFDEFMRADHDYIKTLAARSHDLAVTDLHTQVSGLYTRLQHWEKEYKKAFLKVTDASGKEVEIPPTLDRALLELKELSLENNDKVDILRRYTYIAMENGASMESARDMLSTSSLDKAGLSDDTGMPIYYGKFMHDAIVDHYREKMMDVGNHLITHMTVQEELNRQFSVHHALSEHKNTPYVELTSKQKAEISYDSLQAMLLGRPTKADGWAINVENSIKLFEAETLGTFLGELKNTNMLDAFMKDPAVARNILRSFIGLTTDIDGKPLNATITKFGDLWYNRNMKVNDRFAQTGRPVTLSKSYQGLSITHDKSRIIGNEGFDGMNREWFDFLLNPENVDWESTFMRRGWMAVFDGRDERTGESIKVKRYVRSSDFEADSNGVVPIESAKANYLSSMWEEMWRESKEVPADDLDGAGAASKTHRQSIVFIEDKGLDYVSKWGVETNLAAAMINSLASSARSAELYRNLGRNPKATVEAFVKPLREGGVLDAVHAESLVGAVSEFTHENSRPVNTKMADVTSLLSTITDLIALPFNSVVQLNDFATTHSVLRQYDMAGLMDRDLYRTMKNLHVDRADPELNNMLIGYGVGGSIIQGEILARLKSGALGSFNRGRDHLMNITLMNALRNGQQRMFVVTSLMKYVEISRKLDAGEALNRAEQRLLAVGGIAPERMRGISDAIHAHKIGSHSVDMLDLDKLSDPDLAARLRAVTAHLTTFTSIEPDAGTRAMTVFGTKSGTLIGSIVRLVMKYTAIPSAVQAKTWMRFQNGYGKDGLLAALKDPGSGAAVHMASLMGLTAVIGYSSYAALTFLTGGEVEDPRDMSAGKMARVFLGANLLGRAYTVMNYAGGGDDQRPWNGAAYSWMKNATLAAGEAVVAPFSEKTSAGDVAERVAKATGPLGKAVQNYLLALGLGDTLTTADSK